MTRLTTIATFPALLFAAILASAPAFAQKRYGPGATDSEIKIGQTMPYSGPASAYGVIGKAESAVFAKVNEEGGVNGRKIRLVSLDDGYSPPRTVEQTRKLVEQDQVLFIYQSLGTPPNTAIHKYLNARKVPHLFVATGATKWGDPRNFPWTMGWQPNYRRIADLRDVHPEEPSEREDRHPVPERRLRQGLRARLQGGAGRQGVQDDRGRSLI
jgi:ABC-type branched-subunit amino acid transport system substrate-binding protein